jgi:filamentous hemagglutinin family protein
MTDSNSLHVGPRRLTAALVLALAVASSPASAQVTTEITTDGSLGPGVTVSGTGGDYEIGEDLGARPGDGPNLFHSFARFNVGAGDTARFTADPSKLTDNVISRVTGGTRSDIYGTIASDIDGAKFYFVNPAGIFFGPDASLDLPASFHATTADYLELSNPNHLFHADLARSSVLTAAPVTAFGFLAADPAPLEVASGLLQVDRGETLSLIGGDLTLEATVDWIRLKAISGRIQLVSVASEGEVTIDPATGAAELGAFDELGEIVLYGAKLYVNDPRRLGGEIRMRGDHMVLDYTALFADLGNTGGTVDIRGTGDLELRNGALVDTSGQSGGTIELDVGNLIIEDGSQIWNLNYGNGPGGLIHVTADSARISGWSGDSSGIYSGTTGPGPGGDVVLDVGSLVVEAGGQIDNSVWAGAEGLGGTTQVTATESILITGRILEDPKRNPSSITNDTFGGGPGGAIVVEAPIVTLDGGGIRARSWSFDERAHSGTVDLKVDELYLINGGFATTSTFGEADAGTVTAEVGKKLLISGEGVSHSQLASSTFGANKKKTISGDGDGGNVVVIAPTATVTLDDGGRILAMSFARTNEDGRPGEGDAGNISIDADALYLYNESMISSKSNGKGDAGAVTLDIERLSMSEGSSISSSSTGTTAELGGDRPGAAGSIVIGVEDGKHVTRSVILSDATIATSAVEGPEVIPGEDPRQTQLRREGNISIRGASLLLENGSTIDASVEEGLGGNVDIEAPEYVVLRDGSAILAETEAGTGGAIDIATEVFFASPDSTVSADAGVGNDGIVNISSPEVDIESRLVALPADYLDVSSLLRPSCATRWAEGEREGSFVVARRRGLPTSPEEFLLAFDAVGGGELASAADEDDGLPPVAAAPAGAGEIAVAHAALSQGATAFRGGHFEEAGQRWTEASRLYARGGDAASRCDALRGLAQTQQALGNYAESLETLHEAVALAEQSGDEGRIASALGGLGNAHLALGQPQAAEDLLTRSVERARRAEAPELAAQLLNNLGNAYAARQAFTEALAAYEASAVLAREAGAGAQEARALTNAAGAALDAQERGRAKQLLARASAAVQPLGATHETIYIRIHLARSQARLAEASPEDRAASLRAAHAALLAAIELAQELGEPRPLSYALGNLGTLYQSEHRTHEALYLTRQALRAAEAAEAPESLYRWHWQEGQLLWEQGRAREAIESYRRAVAILEETRQETLARYGSAAVSFRRVVAPVYLDLVDALLQSAARLEVEGRAQPLLIEARDIMEQLKAAELRDYFRDECVAAVEAKTTPLESVSGSAAVVYPILLPDRLELLVSLPRGLERYRVDAPAEAVSRETRALRRLLEKRTTREYLSHAKTLYDWLVRPYAEDLAQQRVETVVFVPGGALRTIPMAALHDGEAFFVERYALAVTPGLSLVDPQRLELEDAKLLLAGVSESVQGFPALSNVPDELRAIHELYGGEIWLDEAFQAARMEAELAQDPPAVVHLASHAVFTGDPETSFLLAHDGRITMERMAEVVAPAQFRRQPLELLTLSACATAAGDERAALGLAGVAIRSGARSALGSLWKIADEPTSQLLVSFYRDLGDPSVSKAAALQRAQTEFLRDPRYQHPAYWSAFILISNWL